MGRIISKSYMGNSTKSTHIVLPHTTIGQSLYTLSILTIFPKGVLTTIESCRLAGYISKVRERKGAT